MAKRVMRSIVAPAPESNPEANWVRRNCKSMREGRRFTRRRGRMVVDAAREPSSICRAPDASIRDTGTPFTGSISMSG